MACGVQVAIPSSCFSHVFMFYLAKRYEIEDLMKHSASGFTDAMSALQSDRKAIASFVALVYRLPDLDPGDLHQIEAKLQAQKLASLEFKEFHADFVHKVKQSTAMSLMPHAIRNLAVRACEEYVARVEVLELEELEADILSEPAVHASCIRCLGTIVEDNFNGPVCTECKDAKALSTTTHLPPRRATGITLTLWDCKDCNQIWLGDGSKTCHATLGPCMCCPLHPAAIKPSRKNQLVWSCANARVYGRHTDTPINPARI
jgi:hypothetical protein